MSKTAKLVLDVVAAALVVAAVLPQLTGITAHEWLGLAALAALLLHIAASLGSLVGLVGAARKGSPLALARIALDAALFVALSVCVVSGMLISATVLSVFGLFAPGYFVWDPLHAISAKVLLTLALVHAVTHAGKLARMAKAKSGR